MQNNEMRLIRMKNERAMALRELKECYSMEALEVIVAAEGVVNGK